MKRHFAYLLAVLLLTGCAAGPVQEKPKTGGEPEKVSRQVHDGSSRVNTIYLAGGCFWGMQKYLQTIPGVERTVTGYANGQWDGDGPVSYEDVSTGLTGFRETVYVEYDPEKVSLETILFAYFYVIDPTIENGQGPDRGSEYQTGIYYTNEADREVIDRVVDIEARRYPRIVVEIEPLEVFHEAEEEHQHYLDKNPEGYCHIGQGQIDWMKQIVVDAARYPRPAQEEIRARLTPLQYWVTQENGTEEPYHNELWDHFEKGIYVDIVSGEPLFSSLDKFESPCGWPAFSQGIDVNTFFFAPDYTTGEMRIEVRSRTANSHLGHLFQGEPDSPTGNRYCINSAALRFVPYEQMEAQGYGYLLFLFEEQARSYTTISPQQAKAMMDEGGVVVLDVREPYEFAQGHIPGAVLLPVSAMGPDSGKEITEELDTPVLIYCRSGNRSKTAAEYVVKMGFTNVFEFGGILDWPYEIVEE